MTDLLVRFNMFSIIMNMFASRQMFHQREGKRLPKPSIICSINNS
jgi:hypothetical protein